MKNSDYRTWLMGIDKLTKKQMRELSDRITDITFSDYWDNDSPEGEERSRSSPFIYTALWCSAFAIVPVVAFIFGVGLSEIFRMF